MTQLGPVSSQGPYKRRQYNDVMMEAEEGGRRKGSGVGVGRERLHYASGLKDRERGHELKLAEKDKETCFLETLKAMQPYRHLAVQNCQIINGEP